MFAVLDKLLILVPVLLLALAQVLLRWQASTVGATVQLADRWAYLRGLAASPWVWLALALAGISFVAWVIVLRRWPLGYAYPFVSLTFPLVALGGVTLLGERLAAGQVFALVLIVAGVALNAWAGR